MRFLLLLAVPLTTLATAIALRGGTDNVVTQHPVSPHDQFILTSKFNSPDSAHDLDSRYDARFMKDPLTQLAHRNASRALIQAYLSICSELGVQTWLMGDSLLGWWWGKKMMTRDYTSNVQITERGLYFLAAYHNASIHYYRSKALPKGRKFLLEISSSYKQRERYAVGAADGRWIDLASGLYLNISAVRYNPHHPNGQGMLDTKNGEEFHDTQLYPLRDTTFEGVPAKIPFRYEEMLVERYGDIALRKIFP
ncbi:mannosyltransferase [Conoideocrella luteorostrata]|uniref:Mannosyltransferase n=1 Tax=Conoideocrella luteorostrata TaxID=1105319 RepID=A0AAJ0G027_9HYPO|nr:mannosyltransferase [Conoideocrella luteorostrata]